MWFKFCVLSRLGSENGNHTRGSPCNTTECLRTRSSWLLCESRSSSVSQTGMSVTAVQIGQKIQLITSFLLLPPSLCPQFSALESVHWVHLRPSQLTVHYFQAAALCCLPVNDVNCPEAFLEKSGHVLSVSVEALLSFNFSFFPYVKTTIRRTV